MLCKSFGLLALVATTNAFPKVMWEAVEADPQLAQRADDIIKRQKGAGSATAIFENPPMFNAKQQFISTRGKYKWVAPGPRDLRGPCPGLNAFANHGYLPHNGYATIDQFLDATMNTVGMGIGLASFLAVYGATIDGDGDAWSIGGTPPTSFLSHAPVGGKGRGISNSHNKYESDASPMRPDLYEYGNDYKVRVQQFQQLSDLQPNKKRANYNLAVLTHFRSLRFDDQIANNPYFFNGPFTGVAVQPAAYTFIYRFMANHSEAHPTGLLSQDVLQSWFSIRGDSGHYKWVPGHERIPDNWYRRALAYPYDQTYFFADLGNAAMLYPKFLDVGGNTGTTNSFTGVDISNLTGGVFNSQTLAQNNNFACLAYEFAANAKPDVALNSLTQLFNTITPLQQALGCPTLENIDESQFNQFPGSKTPDEAGAPN